MNTLYSAKLRIMTLKKTTLGIMQRANILYNDTQLNNTQHEYTEQYDIQYSKMHHKNTLRKKHSI